MNKSSAKEWLIKSWHNISSANILYEANHYTDSIAVEIHYGIEKIFKAFFAYQNQKIPKTHDLFELYKLSLTYVELEQEQINILVYATEYHIQESYPHYARPLPPREEIKEALDFSYYFFKRVCDILEIKKSEVMK